MLHSYIRGRYKIFEVEGSLGGSSIPASRAQETCDATNMYEAITYRCVTRISYAPRNAQAPW